MTDSGFQIAIDGPVAAGKSTVARKLAEHLGFVYVDTGAVYRAVTLAAQREGFEMTDEEALVELAKRLDIDVRMPEGEEKDGRLSTVSLNGEDVSWKIRGGNVTRDVPMVAAMPQVREVLVAMQQRIARGKNVVMEGRDITYVVLPEADLKIYLDASEEVRIERYFQSRTAKDRGLSKEDVATWLMERDYTDKNRAASPLKIVPGVWQLDCSELSIDEVVETIAKRVTY
jgi:cytidylate kinase